MLIGGSRERPAQRWITVILAVCGTAFCLLNILHIGVDAICFTSGCGLYRDQTIFGLSMWWYGLVAFALIGLLALLGQHLLTYFLALLCLLADVGLLIWLAFTMPCISCLIVGLIFFLVFALIPLPWHYLKGLDRLLMIVWLCVFTPNLVAVGNEAMPPWAIYGPEETSARVFFSPSCPACRLVIFEMLQNSQKNQDPTFELGLTLYPLADDPDDIYRIHRLEAALASGLDPLKAFVGLNDSLGDYAKQVSSTDLYALRFKLMRNKVFVLNSGARQIPVTILEGARPELMQAHRPHQELDPKDDVFEPDFGASPWFDDALQGGCSALSDEPCDPPDNSTSAP